MIARRALFIASVTVLVDLMTVTFSYAIARAAWPRPKLPHLAEMATMNPVLLATIPCWLVVFFAFGMYRPKQVLEPSPVRLLGAISVSIVVMIVVAFAFNIDTVHRAWIVALWVVATVLVVMGRLVMQGLAQRLGPGQLDRPA